MRRRSYDILLSTPTPSQQRVLDGARRFNAVTCGRRWGKTEGIGLNQAILGVAAGWPVGWFAPTYKMLADAWRQALRVLHPMIRKRDAQERRIELVTGGILDFWTLDTPDAGRGRRYKRVIIDEAAMVREARRAWQASILPTLSDLSGDAWLLTTPRGFDDYYELTRTFDEQPEGATFQMPTRTNPYIPPSEIELARQVMGVKFFAQEFEAKFESLANRVVHAFDFVENVVENDAYTVPKIGPFFVGMDFNVNPMTASIAVPFDAAEEKPDGKREVYEELVFVDEIELYDSGTEEMCEELRRRFDGRQQYVTVFPDPTGHARQTSARRGTTNFTLIEEAGFRYITDDVPLVEDKINELNAMCCSASGRRRLKVMKRCRKLISSFEQLVYKEGTSVVDKGKWDHFVDGACNITHCEYPLVTDTFSVEEAFGV